MANTLLSVQIIPKAEQNIALVEEAIKLIDQSGVKYEVHPLETTMEGDLGELLRIVEKINIRMIELGASYAIAQVKILYQPSGVTMEEKTEKFR